MRGYLLDTNHISAYFDKNPRFMKKMASKAPDELCFICAVSLGEVAASYKTTNRDQEFIRACRKFMRDEFTVGPNRDGYVHCIDETTDEYYGDVIATLQKNYVID